MEIYLNPNQPFNLELTLCCGQVFMWERKGEWWYGTAGNELIKVKQSNGILKFENVSEKFLKRYFRLDDDLKRILFMIAKDQHMRKVVRALEGLRLIRQNPWECLATYICATYKNIPAIKQSIRRLSAKFGEEKRLDGYTFHTFPSAEALAEADQNALAECGLGYRAKYLHFTARKIAAGELNLEDLSIGNYEESRRKLCSLPGVGLKVADCVLLYSLEKLEAFPVDIWIKRAVIRHYPEHFESQFLLKANSKRSLTKREYEKISYFGHAYFGQYAGYAQQYLYHFERTHACQRDDGLKHPFQANIPR